MAKKSFTKEEKLMILNFYHDGGYSFQDVAEMFSISHTTVFDWYHSYQTSGEAGLEPRKVKMSYPADMKKATVEDYLSGSYSLREVTLKYSLSDKSVLRKWIKKYTSHSE